MLRAHPLALLLTALLAADATAQVIVPNIYTNTEAPGSTSLPVHIQDNPWTLQLILNANQLTGLVGKDLTGIAYRSSAHPGGSFPLSTTTWNPYIIRIGPSVAPSAAAGTSFSDNFTAAPTQVRSSSFTAPPFSWENFGAPGPNPFGPELEFDQPFHYTGGDLGVLITHPGSDSTFLGNALMDSTGSASPGRGTDYAYFAGQGFDINSGNSSNFMPVIRFSADTPIPEPTTCLLAAGTALAVACWNRWHRRPAKTESKRDL